MSYADLLIGDGAIALWRLLESQGPAIDDAALAHDGTSTGCTFGERGLIPATFDTCIKFNGAGDLITVADADDLDPGNGSWSVSAWIRSSSSANQFSKLISKRDPSNNPAWGLFIAANALTGANGRQLCFQYRNDGSSDRTGHGAAIIADQGIHHIAAVANKTANAILLYVDGVATAVTMDSTGGGWPVIASTANLTLGANVGGGAGFPGWMAYPALFPLALSAAQVANHYSAGLDAGLGFEPPVDLVALDSDVLAVGAPSAVDLSQRDDQVALRPVG